jgi:hypothetical protein
MKDDSITPLTKVQLSLKTWIGIISAIIVLVFGASNFHSQAMYRFDRIEQKIEMYTLRSQTSEGFNLLGRTFSTNAAQAEQLRLQFKEILSER